MLPPLPDQPVAAEADPTQPSVDHLVPPSALGRLTASSSTITALNSDAILPSPGYQYGSRDSVVSGTSQQDEASGSEDNSKKKSASTLITPEPAFLRPGHSSSVFSEKLPPEEGASDNESDAQDPEKQAREDAVNQRRKPGFPRNLWRWFRRNYWPSEEPELILPSPPSDAEKVLYLHTNRIPLYLVGVFAFLSLSVGMWLFVICANTFYWYGAFAAFIQLYLLISYSVGVIGRDWDQRPHQEALKAHPVDSKEAPSVDVLLPCCLEPIELLENTYKYVRQLEYGGQLKVHVLDDGAQESVRALAAKYGFNYMVRDDRPRLRKAGNLRWAFARTHGDFFVIFDADFCPRADFLTELIPEHLADDKTAIVQTPQYFRSDKRMTWVEQGAGATQELFYRVVQVNRNKWGASICVGSNAVYRRAALEEVGGTAEIGFSEDVHTGFGAVDRGWKVKYVPLCMACGACPDSPRAFFTQQMRWCTGSTTLLLNPAFWRSSLTLMQKICYCCGFLYYTAVAISIFLSPIPGILLLWTHPIYFKYYNLAFAIPSVFYSTILFPLWTKGRYNLNVQHIMVIQNFAYLNALKDKLIGRKLEWIPTFDAKAHKSNKYRNMRIFAWIWWIIVLGGLVSAVTWRLTHDFPWYHTLPLIILDAYNLYIAHPFLFYSG